MKKFALFLAGMLLAGNVWAGSEYMDSNVVALGTTTATQVLNQRPNRKAFTIRNLDAATTVYFSNASISKVNFPVNSAPADTFVLKAGESYTETGDVTYTRELYMIAQASATPTINVIVYERW
jgi:hypothetical protein